MLTYAIAWIAAALVLLALDVVWLTQMVDRLYRPFIGAIMAPRPDMAAAVVFYLIYVTGVVVFAVVPALEKDSLLHAAVLGGFLGLLAYATYDLTNQATLSVWNLRITVVDLVWGTALTAITAAASYAVASRFAPA
jgi:uncharacterized membrane protein